MPFSEESRKHILNIAVENNVKTAITAANELMKMAKIKAAACQELEVSNWEEAEKMYNIKEEKLREFLGTIFNPKEFSVFSNLCATCLNLRYT